MILPDINDLLYAFRADSQNHRSYKRWLESEITESLVFAMSPQALSSLVRIATHPGIYSKPSSLEDAMKFTTSLPNQPNCQVVTPGPRHWQLFELLVKQARATGNLVPDAWFAALAMESNCEWVTSNRGFARFPGLRWRIPF